MSHFIYSQYLTTLAFFVIFLLLVSLARGFMEIIVSNDRKQQPNAVIGMWGHPECGDTQNVGTP